MGNGMTEREVIQSVKRMAEKKRRGKGSFKSNEER